jgi:hypothetical protein
VKYYKTVRGDYTESVGTSPGEIEITQAEYEKVIAGINEHAEHPEENIGFRLRADLTWEQTITD